MGNVQTAPIPRVIQSVESYFDGIVEIKYVQNLGNTRFMKVARVEHSDGPMVAKVFIFPEGFVFERFKQAISNIKKKVALSKYSNCIGFTKQYAKENLVIICRPFHKETLHDRLSTRPFLTTVEKQWIAFQLLKSLEQCRREGICHGDIKSHNVLVSSSMWVNLTDFASFKPTFIPLDSPSAFTFFYNTSRQSCCNMAPERFKKSIDFDMFNTDLPENLPELTLGKTDAMDIFSMGCVLVELFTDGRKFAFSYGQLIDYISMDEDSAREYVATTVETIPEQYRKLVSIMLEKNPVARKEMYDEYKPFRAPGLFPPIFESFLYQYIGEFRVRVSTGSQQIVPRSPDDVITKLYVEKDRFMAELVKDKSESLLLLISLITSNVRACKTIAARMDAISLLKQLSLITTETLAAERIVPYLVKLISDPFVHVQTEAIHVLSEIVSSFKKVPTEETRLFVDYIFPKMKEVLSDSCTLIVTMAIATNLGSLALMSLEFLKEGIKHAAEEGGVIGPSAMSPTTTSPGQIKTVPVSEMEKKSLIDTVTEFYTQFITHDNKAVRQTIMEAKNLDKLCQFFDKIKGDTQNLLMHMITVLNDKNDWRLMSSFFKNCPVVARSNPITRNSEFFYPLLQQGLQSTEEFVILESLRCIYALCNENRLEKATVWELCKDFVQFIVHPNVWLRIATVDILKVLDESSPFADVYCRLMPHVKPFLREPLIRLNDKAAIHECLVEPIPRAAWRLVCECKYPNELFKELEGRMTLNKLGGGRNSLFSSSPPISTSIRASSKPAQKSVESILNLLHNHASEDASATALEEKILAFSSNLRKKVPIKKKEFEKFNFHILKDVKPSSLRVFDLDKGHHVGDIKNGWKVASVIDHGGKDFEEHDLLTAPTNKDKTSDVACDLTTKSMLEELLTHKRERYLQQKRVNDQDKIAIGAAAFSNSHDSRTGSNSGTLEIRLVSHLHEHAEKITKLTTHADQTTFATSSGDSTVKLWSLNQIKNKTPSAVTSTITIPHPSKVNSCQFMTDNSNHLVTATEGGVLSIYDVESKRFLNQTAQVDEELEGGLTHVSTYDHLIYGLTAQSSVFCYDKRTQNPRYNQGLETIFQRKARSSYGYITSMSVDPVNQHWMVLTSSTAGLNNIFLYDLRFLGLEVAAWGHPQQKALVLSSWPIVDPNAAECTQVATGISKEGELSVWNLNMGQSERSHILYSGGTGSNESRILTKQLDKQLTYHYELQTSALTQASKLNGLFTGDSQGSLRFWSLTQPQSCKYLCGPYREHLVPPLSSKQAINASAISYVRVDDEGVIVIKESKPKGGRKDSFSFDQDSEKVFAVGEQHRDGITDMGMLGDDYLASTDRSGVVKIWKIFDS